jgi:hypothetical protein
MILLAIRLTPYASKKTNSLINYLISLGLYLLCDSSQFSRILELDGINL